MEYICVSTESLVKKWKQTEDNILKLQRSQADKFPCDVECLVIDLLDSKYFRIPTPLPTFNNLTQGGFKSGTVTELCGPPASGKSQFCLTLIANYLVENDDRNVIYVDTNKNFSFNRLFQLWNASMNGEISEVISKRLSRLYLWQPLSKAEFVGIFEDLDKFAESLKPTVIIVDSVAYFIRGMANVIDRVILSTKLIAIIKKVSVKHNIMVVVTNQVTGYSKDGKPDSALGSSWLHHLNLRLHFDLDFREDYLLEDSFSRKVCVVKSPSLINFSIPFRILGAGVEEI